jgi:hypothetical protein
LPHDEAITRATAVQLQGHSRCAIVSATAARPQQSTCNRAPNDRRAGAQLNDN